MVKFSSVLVLSVLLVASAFANVPLQDRPEDVSYGAPCDPILGNWATDVVTWTQQANATATHRRAASAYLGDYWYCFGDQSVATAHAYNMVTNQWEVSTPPLIGTCNWTGVATNDHFYIIGRYNPGYGNEVQRFTPDAVGAGGTWAYMAPYPQLYCGVAAAWDGGDFIYAAGGGGTSSVLAYVYSISGDMWMPIASMPGLMKYCGGGFADGKFVVMGGITTPGNAVYVYDPGTDTWTTGASMPTAAWFATFSVSNDPGMDLVYSIGGGGGYSTWPAIDAVQLYDPDTDTWTQETVLPVAYGTNASDYCYDGIGMSSGGYDGVANHAETYQGTDFPGGGPPPVWDMNVDLTYIGGSPVPAGGGNLMFGVFVEHFETVPINFEAWL
ncbi:hypothetical protein KKA00_05630, partial [bacterium]|nr:hypothetical protein [bacterium]